MGRFTPFKYADRYLPVTTGKSVNVLFTGKNSIIHTQADQGLIT